MAQEFADSDLWHHLKCFSRTLLRSELMDLRRQLRDDIGMEMSSFLERLESKRKETRDFITTNASAISRGQSFEVQTASTDLVTAVSDMCAKPSWHSLGEEAPLVIPRTSLRSNLSTRSNGSVHATASFSAHAWMRRPVRGYHVLEEVRSAELDFEQEEAAGAQDGAADRDTQRERSSTAFAVASTNTTGVGANSRLDRFRNLLSSHREGSISSMVSRTSSEKPTGSEVQTETIPAPPREHRHIKWADEDTTIVDDMAEAWHDNGPSETKLPGSVQRGGSKAVDVRVSCENSWGEKNSSTIDHRIRPYRSGRVSSTACMRAPSQSEAVSSKSFGLASTRSRGRVSPFWKRVQRIVRRSEFDAVACILILVNAISIGIQVDVMSRENLSIPPNGFRIVEGLFCVAFSIELTLRIGAFRLRFFSMFGWRWNVFDCIVVTLQLFETFFTIIVTNALDADAQKLTFDFSIMRMLRVLRLVRIVRVIRVLRFVGDLRTLVYSVFGTLRLFLWCCLLMLLLIYITGVQFTQMVADYKLGLDLGDPRHAPAIRSINRYFGSLSRSLLSLFASVSGGVDWQDCVDPLIEHIHPFLAILYCAYIAFGVFALLNVVTGIFVQSAMVAAKQDNETYVVNHVRELFANADVEGTGVLTWPEFEARLITKEMKEYFKHLDIDITEAEALFSLLDLNGDGEISADEFLNGSLRLRGQARALEMEVMMRALSGLNESVEALLHQTEWLCLPDNAVQRDSLRSIGAPVQKKNDAVMKPDIPLGEYTSTPSPPMPQYVSDPFGEADSVEIVPEHDLVPVMSDCG